MRKLKEFIILNFLLPISDMFFHTHIKKWYNEINRLSKVSPNEIMDWQNQKIRELVNHAYNNTVYYRELFDSLNLKPNDINCADDLYKLPPLTKEIIRSRFDDIIPKNIGLYKFHNSKTGGSTGDPMKFIMDNNTWGFTNAFNIYMWKKIGYRYGDKFVALGSSSIFPVNKKSYIHNMYYKLKGKIPFNTMNMSDEIIDEIIKFISKNNIHYIYGYASSIYIIAKYVEKHNLSNIIDIKACFPTSELLSDTYRYTIKSVFKCQIVNSYGACDGGVEADDIGNGFFVGYNCIIQMMQKSTKFDTALYSNVLNFAFPMLRYQLGDVLELGESYNDLFNGQIINNVIGRTSDILFLENGRILTGPGFTILFANVNVSAYKIYKVGNMEINVDIVTLDGYSVEQERLIIDTIIKYAGSDCKVNIYYKDKIKSLSNGKSSYFLIN